MGSRGPLVTCLVLALSLSAGAEPSGTYALAPDGTVLHGSEPGGAWRPIGRGFRKLIGGGGRLFAIHESDDIYEFGRDWTRIGGPGYQFILDEGGRLCGISPGMTAVWCYNDRPMDWTQVGGPMSRLLTRGRTLYGIGPNSDGLYRYEGRPGAWTRVGPPATDVTFDGPRLSAPVPIAPRCYYTTAIRHRCTGIPYDTRLDTEVDQVCNGCLTDSHCTARPGGRCVETMGSSCMHASKACAYPGDPCRSGNPFNACSGGRGCINDNGRAVCGPMPTDPP